MLKLILEYVITNALIVLTICISVQLLGFNSMIAPYHLSFWMLALLSSLWALIGSLFCLFFVPTIAQSALGITKLSLQNKNEQEHILINSAHEYAQRLGLTQSPRLGIYNSPELNVLVLGSSKNNALIAISSSLMLNMKTEELKALLAHAVMQVATNNMVSRSLLQGMVNAYTFFIPTLLLYCFKHILLYERRKLSKPLAALIYRLLLNVFNLVFTFLAVRFIALLSRWQCYKLDRLSTRLIDKDNLIFALQNLKNAVDLEYDKVSSINFFKLTQHHYIAEWFSAFPSLSKRINKLRSAACL